MRTERKQQSFQYGAAIMLVSAVLVKLIGALFKIPLASSICLGDLGFGYFSSAYDLFTPIYSLAMAGLPVALARTVSEHMAAGRYKDVRATLKISRRIYSITGFAGFMLMLALIYPFVSLSDKTGQTVYSLFAIAPSMLFCCIISAYRGYYEGLRNMYPTAVSELIEALCKLVLGFGFAFITVKITGNVAYGAAAAMLGITFGTLIAAIYLKLYHRLKGDRITDGEFAASPDAVIGKQAAKALIVLAVPIALASLCNNIASLIDVSMVKWQLSRLMSDNVGFIREMYSESVSGYNATSALPLTDGQLPTFLYGIRGKAYTLFNLVPTLTSVIGVTAVPVIAEFSQRKDFNGLKRNTESVLKLTAVISFPIAMGFIAVGDRIMRLLYSTEASVQIGGPLLNIFGFAVVFAGLAIPMNGVLQAIGKQKAALFNIAVGAAVKLTVNFMAVGNPNINIKGAALGTFACYFIIFCLNFVTFRKAVGVLPEIKNTLIKPLTAAVLCGIAAYLVSLASDSSVVTCLAIIAAGIVYFFLLILLNTFSETDFSGFPKGKSIIKFCKKHRIIR